MCAKKQTVESIAFEDAVSVFLEGFCRGKSLTHPYEFERVGSLWLMRDAARSRSADYRKEEWIACNEEPALVDALARSRTRGRYFVGAFQADAHGETSPRDAYRDLGYRLIATEPFFVHDLRRIPLAVPDVVVQRVRTSGLARQFGKVSRSRPLPAEFLATDSPIRQYVALDGDAITGWVRSVTTRKGNWCSNFYVVPKHRRQGIGRAMLLRMLRDDRRAAARASVLLSSHTGAHVYPQIGYRQIGTLWIFAPKRSTGP